jgi:hypothetical protein
MNLGKNHNPNDPDASPDYDEWFWDSYWDCNDWMQWHKALKSKYGLRANEIWLQAWIKNDRTSHARMWCRLNEDFVAYFNSQGIDVQTWIQRVVFNTGDIVESVTEAAPGLTTNVTSAVGSIAKVLPWAVGLAAIGAGFYVYEQVSNGKPILPGVNLNVK